MRIAIYNVWNHELTWGRRVNAIAAEISRIKPDLIALQEVPGVEEGRFIADLTQMPYYTFKKYPSEEREGLAFLSNTPIEEVRTECSEINECAYRIVVQVEGIPIGVTNVHLNWRSASIREKEIVYVTDWISRAGNTNYELLCGDFNCTPNLSGVYKFLVGEQTLQSRDAQWVDLAERYQRPTLDFLHNPWLQNRSRLNDTRLPRRYDWILLHSCYPAEEPDLVCVELFGESAMSEEHVIPSDHYGVLAELVWPEKS